jgi:lipopolysaccharide transport system permease protein
MISSMADITATPTVPLTSGDCPLVPASPPESAAAPSFDVLVEAGRSEKQYWRDLGRYWELLLVLAWREVAIRYKQTTIGIAWVLVRPVTTVVVLTVVFGRLAQLPAEGTAYPLLVMAAMLPWQLFSSSVGNCCSSLVGNANLITKVYFPRLIIPLSCLLANLVDFVITAVLMVILMVYYGQMPGLPVIFLPLFLVLTLVFSGGVGLWLGALNVRYRDVTQVVPFLIQLGLYISPIGYSTDVVPERWRLWFSLNPVVGIVDGFRWCLLDSGVEPYWPGILMSVLISVILLATGVWYFRRTERTFADLI